MAVTGGVQRLAVIGLGLIGGSLTKSIRKNKFASQTVGYSLNFSETKLGVELGVVDEAAASIEEAVKNYRSKGYCYSFGDWDEDVNGVAVPLHLGKSNVFAFNAGGPAYRLTPEFLENEVAPQLKNMVRDIEAMLIRD